MKKPVFLQLIVVMLSGSLTTLHAADVASSPNNTNPQEAKAQHADIGVDEASQRVSHTQHPDAQWFGQPQFGLFLHWGISVAGGYPDISWPMIPGSMPWLRGLSNTRIAEAPERERILREKDFQLSGKPFSPTPTEYWKAAETFNPQRYDAEKWIAAAKDAGFTYAVLTTRHHDGFAMWPSNFGDFNTKNHMGGRDLVKPFIDACRKYGLKVGLYYSPQDWYFDRDYKNFLWSGTKKMNPEFPALDGDLNPRTTVPDPKARATHLKAYGDMIRGQIEELLTRYGTIDLLWFDGCPPELKNCITFARMRELQPGIVLNPRLNGQGDFKTFESSLPITKPEKDWAEFCCNWAYSWTYTTKPFKSNASILEKLARCRSFKVNFLLGIGPDKDGELHPSAYQNMAIIASWMKANGESVRDTDPLPEGEISSVPAAKNGGSRYLYVSPEFISSGGKDKDIKPLADVTVTLQGIAEPHSIILLGDATTLAHVYNVGTRTLSITIPAARRTLLMDVVKVE